jgi:ABC-type branched-subunit amino acid transport system ATPase component
MAESPVPPPLVEQGVSKRYGPTVALADVTLEIPAGALTALIGPNAAGKSSV